MPGLWSQGFKGLVLTANTAGTAIGQTTTANTANALIQGFLHAVTVGADSSANTITIYDGLSTGGAVLWKVVTAATTVPQNFIIDMQADTGLFVVLAGGTTPTVSISYA